MCVCVWGGAYPSAEMQSLYSTADWAVSMMTIDYVILNEDVLVSTQSNEILLSMNIWKLTRGTIYEWTVLFLLFKPVCMNRLTMVGFTLQSEKSCSTYKNCVQAELNNVANCKNWSNGTSCVSCCIQNSCNKYDFAGKLLNSGIFHLLSLTYSLPLLLMGGAYGVMVIAVGNGHGN